LKDVNSARVVDEEKEKHGIGCIFMASQDNAPRELCRVKKAVTALIRQNPDGMEAEGQAQ
jgi:hypothetical protein